MEMTDYDMTEKGCKTQNTYEPSDFAPNRLLFLYQYFYTYIPRCCILLHEVKDFNFLQKVAPCYYKIIHACREVFEYLSSEYKFWNSVQEFHLLSIY